MKAYHLYNLTELGPASPLHFLTRAAAEGYRDYVRWPYVNTGRFPLHEGGSVALNDLDLRVEEVELHALEIPKLEILLVEREGVVGVCHLLPGRCFDPDTWMPAGMAELAHPEAGLLLKEAERKFGR